MLKRLSVICIFLSQYSVGYAAPDKNQFHLFNPAPVQTLRGLSTDRPDQTESPYTVDAGHFQLEMDSFSFTRSRLSNDQTDELAVAPVNIKVGLSNQVDLQLLINPYLSQTLTDLSTGATSSQRGYGDLTTRLKVNIWGNDDGSSAFAVMPFVTFPSNQNGLGNSVLTGGVILPLALGLSDSTKLGLMTEFAVAQNSADSGRHVETINSVTVGHSFTENIGGYAEFFSAISVLDPAAWVGMLDFGMTYGWADNIQLDAGVNLGVTSTAPNFNPFVGLALRL